MKLLSVWLRFIVFYLRGCGHCRKLDAICMLGIVNSQSDRVLPVWTPRSMESTWGSLALELKDQASWRHVQRAIISGDIWSLDWDFGKNVSFFYTFLETLFYLKTKTIELSFSCFYFSYLKDNRYNLSCPLRKKFRKGSSFSHSGSGEFQENPPPYKGILYPKASPKKIKHIWRNGGL